jgi:hypothetical protein
VTTDDLERARHRRQIETLKDAAEDRELFALYRQVLDHQQEAGGFPERVDLGGGHHAVLLG